MKQVFMLYEKLLKECEHLEKMISKKDFELVRVKALLMPVTEIDAIECEILALKEKYHGKYLASLIEAQKIENRIDMLKDPVERTLMRLRYVERLEWVEIYEEINWGRSKTHEIHRDILDRLQFDSFGKTFTETYGNMNAV